MRDHQDEFDVKKMSEVLHVSTSGFYDWLRRGVSARELRRMALKNQIKAISSEGRGAYGSPRIYAVLKQKQIICSKATVERLMSEMSIKCKVKKKFKVTTNSKHKYPISPNLLKRNFAALSPNQRWVGDITYIGTDEGWLYLATVIDLFSRRVLGWSMSDTIDRYLAIDALKMAIGRASTALTGLIFHSDRGVQYACTEFRDILANYGILQSMSRKGNCWDNAPAESFFHLLKVEHVFNQHYKTRAEARASIFEWIEVFYNRNRVHSSIGNISPEAYEKNYWTKIVNNQQDPP